MEWTREKTLSLINEYKKRRGLWDMTHDDYRKKDVKQKLLLEVSASLGGGIPIVEIEKKFHTLRTQYHREINRMKRKEPYNSKWFGFKNLQFLSSPKACRSSKGRIKSEITEDGTVTKYIIRETNSQHDNSEGSPNSSNNISEEFVTIHHRKPTVAYEVGNVSSICSRSRELEKLIEETTKDIDIEDAKPKMTIKEITVPIDDHGYSSAQQHINIKSNSSVGGGCDMSTGDESVPMNNHGQMEEDDEPIETIDLQGGEDEILYNTTIDTGNGGDNNHNHSHHHHARNIKIQRRDTSHEDEYPYEEEHQQAQQQQHQTHHLHSMPTKRIYYESNGNQHTATILATPITTSPNVNSTMLNSIAKVQQQHHHQPQLQQNRTIVAQTQQLQLTPPSQQQIRDEFSTYGEYVANELREIKNREILVALKHKINTALFEANMAELQK